MKKTIIIIATLLLLTGLNIYANLIQSKKDGNWSSTSTWVGGILPTTTDDIQINNNDDLTIQYSNTYTIAELWMGNGSSLTIEGNLTIDSLHINNNATLNVNGTLIIKGGISISNNSELVVNSNGTVDIQGDFTAANRASLIIDGSVNVEGSVSFSNNGSITIGDTGNLNIAQNLDTGGATINGIGPITVLGTVSGTNSGDSQINTPLPIELVQFNIKCVDSQVLINWSTASELNNDYFTIQRSENGVNYKDLAIIKGAGNSSSIKNYHYFDQNPISSISYYRLKQTDFNGKFEIFKPKAINIEFKENKLDMHVYPNPVLKGETVTILIDGVDKNTISDIILMDNSGTIIEQLQLESDDFNQVVLTKNTSNLEKGVYIIWFQTSQIVINKKFIIK